MSKTQIFAQAKRRDVRTERRDVRTEQRDVRTERRDVWKANCCLTHARSYTHVQVPETNTRTLLYTLHVFLPKHTDT